MKSAVIVLDHAGYSLRALALKDAHDNVFVTTPETHPNAYAEIIPIPHDWIQADENKSLNRRCWFKADAMAFAAVKHLSIDADFYWFIESDVAAEQVVWKRLFEKHKDNDTDHLSIFSSTIETNPDFEGWTHPGTPDDVDLFSLMSIFRLSKRALNACIDSAIELRECFGESAIPYVIKMNGFSHDLIDPDGLLMDSNTMCAYPSLVRLHLNKINHPIKSNTYGVPR